MVEADTAGANPRLSNLQVVHVTGFHDLIAVENPFFTAAGAFAASRAFRVWLVAEYTANIAMGRLPFFAFAGAVKLGRLFCFVVTAAGAFKLAFFAPLAIDDIGMLPGLTTAGALPLLLRGELG